MTLPADGYERQAMLRRIATFMAWKQARAFTLATELYEPDCVWCACIATNERQGCIARIQRKPTPWTARNFGAVEWLAPATIDPAIVELLPGGPRAMTPKELSALQKCFGTEGKFPAVHIATGELRGV